MNWLIWRQHRKQWYIFLSLLAIFIVIVVPSGLNFWNDYQRLSATCRPTNSCNMPDLRDTIFNSQLDGLITNFVKLTLLGIPFVLGLFWGVPLLAKEYSEKTNKLVWTQGISRKKWLSSKLIWVLGATIIYAGALSALATWFTHTANTVNQDRFNPLAFSSQGIVPVFTAVFAVSLGILFGTWFKKIIPALGATLALLIVTQIAIPLLIRPHYAKPYAYTTSSLLSVQGDPSRHPVPDNVGAWVVSDNMINNKGEVFAWDNPPASCKIADPAAAHPKDEKVEKRHAVIGRNDVFLDLNCLNDLGYHWEIKYQPSYRYWNFQQIESGLYVVLTLGALSGTYALVLKRDA